MSEFIPVSSIKADREIQSREQLNQEVIEEYFEKMLDGEKFPALVIFDDGNDYWLADGFHRYHAAVEAEFETIECKIEKGTRRDAILYSVGANGKHGLRRTNADKRKAALILLQDEEWGKWSAREIAEKCGVGKSFISNIKNELSTVDSDNQGKTVTYTDKHGNTSTMNTSKIGKSKGVERSTSPETGGIENNYFSTDHATAPENPLATADTEVYTCEIVEDNEIPIKANDKDVGKHLNKMLKILTSENIVEIDSIDWIVMKNDLRLLQERIKEIIDRRQAWESPLQQSEDYSQWVKDKQKFINEAKRIKLDQDMNSVIERINPYIVSTYDAITRMLFRRKLLQMQEKIAEVLTTVDISFT